LQLDGNEIANPTGQYLNSSITQLVAGYDITNRFALQINAPLIYREFKRPEGFQIDRGTVSGLGDISLLLKTVLFHYASPARRSFEFRDKNPIAIEHEPDFTVSAILLAGIKFPTGDSSRLEEEFHEIEIPDAPESGIHGHDLTLGTGSYDGIFGEQTSLRYKNFFFETNVQFALRGDGTHQYHFANDLLWAGGPRLLSRSPARSYLWSAICRFWRIQRCQSISRQGGRRHRNYFCFPGATIGGIARPVERGSRR
jgi:hypothetical protein